MIMNKKIKWLAYGIALMGLGFTMPSCPGQQAMQQQIDALQTKVNDTGKQVHALDSQVRQLTSDVSQIKNVITQLNNFVGAQKITLDQLDAKLSALTTKPGAKKGAAKKKVH